VVTVTDRLGINVDPIVLASTLLMGRLVVPNDSIVTAPVPWADLPQVLCSVSEGTPVPMPTRALSTNSGHCQLSPVEAPQSINQVNQPELPGTPKPELTSHPT